MLDCSKNINTSLFIKNLLKINFDIENTHEKNNNKYNYACVTMCKT